MALEPPIPCGCCPLCRAGLYNLRPDVACLATPAVDGAYCEYVVHPAAFAFELPEGMSFEEGAV